MIRFTEQLFQTFDELERHHLLAAVIVCLDHHWLQGECSSFAELAPLRVGI